METVVIHMQCHDRDELEAVVEQVSRQFEVDARRWRTPAPDSPEPYSAAIVGQRKNRR